MEQEIPPQKEAKEVPRISSVKVAKNLVTFFLLVILLLLVLGNIILFFLPHSPLLDFLIYGW